MATQQVEMVAVQHVMLKIPTSVLADRQPVPIPVILVELEQAQMLLILLVSSSEEMASEQVQSNVMTIISLVEMDEMLLVILKQILSAQVEPPQLLMCVRIVLLVLLLM